MVFFRVEGTQKRAQIKLEAIETNIITNHRLSDDELEAFYDGAKELQPGLYLENILEMQEYWTGRLLSGLGKTTSFMDEDGIGYDQSIVNAYYSPVFNAIAVPLGILHFPFYHVQRTAAAALNFGAVGSVVGHEFTHGFDNNGALFDENGDVENWWSEDTMRAFREKQMCFVDQYSSFPIRELDRIPGYEGRKRIDGNNTLGENIAGKKDEGRNLCRKLLFFPLDNGGLRQAFRAYKMFLKDEGLSEPPSLPGLPGLTDDQLFFISYASMWCEKATLSAFVSQLSNVHPPKKFR